MWSPVVGGVAVARLVFCARSGTAGEGAAPAPYSVPVSGLEGALARRAGHSEADVGVGRLAGEEAGRVWGDR